MDRAIFIYSIMTGKTLDVGKIIQDFILTHIEKDTLVFPSLITELCDQAGVKMNGNMEHAQDPKEMMDDDYYRTSTIIQFKASLFGPKRKRSEASVVLSKEEIQIEDRITQIKVWMAKIRRQQKYAFQYQNKANDALAQMLTQVATHLRVKDFHSDMQTYPSDFSDENDMEEEEDKD
ncbi:hypothetical protein PTKIN_Ptkin10aG0078300 [Pterospermum kingtungense]